MRKSAPSFFKQCHTINHLLLLFNEKNIYILNQATKELVQAFSSGSKIMYFDKYIEP